MAAVRRAPRVAPAPGAGHDASGRPRAAVRIPQKIPAALLRCCTGTQMLNKLAILIGRADDADISLQVQAAVGGRTDCRGRCQMGEVHV